MKKFLSIFVALAMVLSLFAGVGARSAKAVLTTTPASVAATNGTVTITLTAADAGIVTGDFTATSTIGTGTATALTLAGFTNSGTTVTYTFAPIVRATAAQSVVVAVTGGTTTVTAGAFVVPADAIPTGTVALATPTQVAATTNVKLDWTYTPAADPTTISAFKIYRNQTGAAIDVVDDYVATVGSTLLTYTDETTTASQPYYYWVNAINAIGAGTGVAVSGPKFILTTAATGTSSTATLSSIALVPATVTVAGGASAAAFTATATYSDGTTATVAPVAYTLTSGVGVVTTPAGVYTAPAATVAAQTAVVTGTYTEGGVTKTATATVTILGTHPLSSIAITPATVTLAGGATQVFTMTATYVDGTTATVVPLALTPGLGTFGTGAKASTYTAPAATVAAQTDFIHGTYTENGITATPAYAVVTISASVVAPPAGTAPLGTVVLAIPTQPATTTNVALSWTYSAADETGFHIYRNLTGLAPVPATDAYIATAVAGTTGTFTDTTTVANQVYYYWVGAYNATGTTLSTWKSIITTAATVVVPVIPGATTTGTLGITTTGTFVGGVDGSGALGVNGVGKVVSGSGTSYVVNVTTAAVGVLDTANGIQVLHDTGVTSVDTDWAATGIQTITLGTLPLTGILNVGDTIRVAGSSTNGSGKILGIDAAGTHAVVNVTTAAVGVIGPQIYKTSYLAPAVIDADWMTVGTAQNITLDAAATLVPGDKLTVYMLQAVPATAATAFFMVTGTPVVGDVATVTWQDTTGASHTVSYTTVAGDTSNKVALALSQLVDALDVTTGNVYVENTPITGSVVQLTQDVGGVAGNGKTLTGTTTAAVVPTLTISTLGGLTQPAYVEQGKTLQLVAKDATGAVVSVTWTSSVITNASVSTSGLVTAASVASNLTGVTVITATSGTATGVFAVVVIPVQIITSLTINLVPAVPVSTTAQQFGAIASNATYSALDYTTQAVWTDALAVASIKATTGLLTYSTDETGNVYASAGGITTTANVKIATGVVTLVPVVGPVTKVIVLTIGSDIVTVDDKATTVDSPPAIVAGRTFVPIRFIAETFGSTVTWLPETKGITIVLGDTTIGLQIGNATAVINGTIIALEAAPYINPDADRTMVPLRVISESFGGNVAWDPINHIITITYVLPVLPAV